eukprot:s1480_g8.t1
MSFRFGVNVKKAAATLESVSKTSLDPWMHKVLVQKVTSFDAGSCIGIQLRLLLQLAPGPVRNSVMRKLPAMVKSILAVLSICVAQPQQATTARYHEQLQDHFDLENNSTWPQAYYVNATYWRPGSRSPIFLCVGGEGPPLDSSVVVRSVHCNLAVEWLREKQALMFALEHRYYGCHNRSACPVSDLDAPDSLRYLSSRQAVEDIAHFVKAMKAEYKLTSRNLWITWGGSYPGMLAGWSRLKHPGLIHASIASSAPVSATYDMPQYLDHVAYAYTVSDEGVGGSLACRDAIRKGHEWVEHRFQAGDLKAITDKFDLPAESLSSQDSRVAFAASGVADFPAQENDPLCAEPGCNIAKVCAIMTNQSLGDEVQRLVQLRKVQNISGFPQTGMLQVSRAPGRTSSFRVGLQGIYRQEAELPDFWFYQTCKEFGFYQTCAAGGGCMFVRGLANASYFAAGCMRQFNISLEEVQNNIDATNDHYGGQEPLDDKGKLGSCVMFPNGQVDPWSTQSVLQSPSPDLPVLMIPGASHHAWTWPSRPEDQESVLAARTSIRQQADAFLRKPCEDTLDNGHKHRNLLWILVCAGAGSVVFALTII